MFENYPWYFVIVSGESRDPMMMMMTMLLDGGDDEQTKRIPSILVECWPVDAQISLQLPPKYTLILLNTYYLILS